MTEITVGLYLVLLPLLPNPDFGHHARGWFSSDSIICVIAAVKHVQTNTSIQRLFTASSPSAKIYALIMNTFNAPDENGNSNYSHHHKH